MDGNGRWARQKSRPRVFGHRAGARKVREIVEYCARLEIKALSLFAFSTENWQRPASEVQLLMELFLDALKRQAPKLNANNIVLRIIGAQEQFSSKLKRQIQKSEELTKNNTGMILNIAADYGGRWDILQAARQLALKAQQQDLNADTISEQDFKELLSMHGLPDPELFIRTGGEYRISNFLIWQLAYTELYFTETLWPDFSPDKLDKALIWFGKRQRRFGKTSEQLS